MSAASLIPTVDSILLFMLVFTRLMFTLSMLPAFGMTAMPMRFKAGLGAAMTLMVLTFLEPDSSAVNQGGGLLVLAFLSEAMLGLALGFLVRLVIEAASLGASIIGFQMGFAVANVIDPQSGATVSLMGTFQALMAGAVFLASGMYRFFLKGLIGSFRNVPPGTAAVENAYGRLFYEAGGSFFITAILVAAPIMVSMLITKIALGVMARTVPQMNIFIVGMPLTIGMGLVLMGLALPFMVHVIVAAMERSASMYQALILVAKQ
jgi:flagellar biosynthetic protein FliR